MSTFTGAATTEGRAWAARWAKDPASEMAAIVRDHRRAIHAAARATCGDDLAADVVQEVFLRIWQHPERYDPTRGPIRPYLLMLTNATCMDVLRSEQRRRARELRVREHDPMRLEDWDVDPPIDVTERVQSALADLDESHRVVVVASFLDHQPHRLIAVLHQIPEGTVKSRIRHGLLKMRRSLGDLDPAM